MPGYKTGRRASFADQALLQGRRPSLLEKTVDALQSQVSGNNDLAVPFNFRHMLILIGGVAILPFFLPTLVLIFGALPLLLLYVVTDFLRVWEPQWTLKTALLQYVMVRIWYTVGIYKSWRYHKNSLDVRAVQERTLLKTLARNAGTAYALDNKLGDIKNVAAFMRSHPLSRYTRYAPYVDRMLNGETNIMTSEEPIYYGKTSGTTGQPAIVPFTPFTKRQHMGSYSIFSYNAQRKVQFEELHKLRPVWKIVYANPKFLKKTPSGVLTGPLIANPLWAQTGDIYTVPRITFEIEDSGTASYVQLIFALRYRNLGAIDGVLASLVYFAFKKLENEWPLLVENVRNGSIRQDLNLTDEIREELLTHLTPDPARANELEEQFEKGFDNIASRIWPELKIIDCITTGPFGVYARFLREKYTRDILLYSTSIVASEGFIGVNFWPQVQPSRYALLPDIHFYEFIPIETTAEVNPRTFLMDKVDIGRDYEVVLTSATGFSRYRLGDVVRVVSFYNQVPVVEFRHRSGTNLNIRGEKIPELAVFDCLKEAALQLAPKLKELVDYTSCENIMLDVIGFKNDKKGSYHVLFVEMTTESPDTNQAALAGYLASTYDEVMLKSQYKYLEYRKTGSLEEAYIYPIQSGGFDRLREYLLKTSNVSPKQLKIPRVLQKKELVQFMINERIVYDSA